MREIKFKATIPLTEFQKKESKKMDGRIAETATIIFTFKRLLNPTFSIREILIPWLLEGNQPEIIEENSNE